LIRALILFLSLFIVAVPVRANDRCVRVLADAAQESTSRRRPPLDRAPVTLEEVREVIRAKGLFTVFPGTRPPPDRVRELEAMHGTPLVFAGDFQRGSGKEEPPAKTYRLPGVALHFGDYGSWGMDHIIGDLNLHNVLKDASDRMAGKVDEVKILNRHAPGVMPPTKFVNDLLRKNPALARSRTRTRKLIESLATTADLRKELENYVALFYGVVGAEFPEGSFFKLEGEFKTGDADTLLTSFSTQPNDLVDPFLRSYAQLRGRAAAKEITVEDLTESLDGHANRKIDLLGRLLYSPAEVLVQRKIDLDHTPLGYPYEIRIDVLGGIPLRPTMRHSWEYLPPELGEAARKFLQEQVLNKLPGDLRRSAAGYDLMVLKDGSFTVVESNAGPMSGTIMGDLNPVLTNTAISELTGNSTDLIQHLEKLFHADVKTQLSALAQPIQFHAALGSPELVEKNRASVFAWLRDRYVAEWKTDPTPKNGRKTLRILKELSGAVSASENDNFSEIYRSAELVIGQP